MTTRAEHLQYCKQRAMAQVEAGDLSEALASMFSDLMSHPTTSTHPRIVVGAGLMYNGLLSTEQQVREFIEGFN